jgi:hypothetical protein
MIFDRVGGSCLPFDFRFAPEADAYARAECREGPEAD